MINFKQVKKNVELDYITEDDFNQLFSKQDLDTLRHELRMANLDYFSTLSECEANSPDQEPYIPDMEAYRMDYDFDVMIVAHYLISTIYGKEHSNYEKENGYLVELE